MPAFFFSVSRFGRLKDGVKLSEDDRPDKKTPKFSLFLSLFGVHKKVSKVTQGEGISWRYRCANPKAKGEQQKSRSWSNESLFLYQIFPGNISSARISIILCFMAHRWRPKKEREQSFFVQSFLIDVSSLLQLLRPSTSWGKQEKQIYGQYKYKRKCGKMRFLDDDRRNFNCGAESVKDDHNVCCGCKVHLKNFISGLSYDWQQWIFFISNKLTRFISTFSLKLNLAFVWINLDHSRVWRSRRRLFVGLTVLFFLG